MANNTGKKFGGREKGTPNKTTQEIKETLKEVLVLELKDIKEVLKKLSPNKKVDVIIKLAQLVLPRATEEEDKGGVFNTIYLNKEQL